MVRTCKNAGETPRALNPDRRFLLEHIGFDRRIVRAEGHYFHDDAGRQYLDFLSQYGAVPFGHNPPSLWEAISRHRAESRPALMQPLISGAAEELAAALVACAPGRMRHATFANSGAEAVEAGIKLARAHTRRRTILSTQRGFHGKTLGALSATDNPLYREPFLLDTTGFDRIAYDDLDALAARLAAGDVAAFLVEPVQGEGGMRVPSPGYLAGASALCRRHGTLLMLDEIQTGLGRTGRMFAAEHAPGLDPDIVLVAKALGGGLLPIGAMLSAEGVWSEAFGYFHSSTFANNQLACTLGLAVLALLQADGGTRLRHAEAMGERLAAGLDRLVAAHPRAFARRTGRGLMQALVLAPWSGECSYFTAHASRRGFAVPLVAGHLFAEHGLVTAPVFNQGATLRLQPALTIAPQEIDRALEALDATARLIEEERFGRLLGYAAGVPADACGPAPEKPACGVRPPRPWEKRRGRFAFLIHPTDEQVLFETLPREFGTLGAEAKAAWRGWMASWFRRMHDPAAVYHLPALRSKQGGYVEGWLIAAPLTPAQMMRLRKDEKAALLEAYLDCAEELGVDITGLGAFTSVISRGGTDLLHRALNLTTGNSLTAISSVESLRAVCAGHGRDFAAETVAVIGAAGSIGRLAALHAGRHARRLLLLGNPANPAALATLEAIAGEVYRKAAHIALLEPDAGLPGLLLEAIGAPELVCLLERIEEADGRAFRAAVEERLVRRGIGRPIVVSVDPAADLGRAGVVLSASGAGKAFVDPRWLAAGSIVCDVARPLDVLAEVRTARRDVFVYEGGLMRLPEDIAFGAQNVLGYPRGIGLACLSETMVLAMDGARRSHSIGAQIDYDEALAIHAKAAQHGFRPAVLQDGALWRAAAPRAEAPAEMRRRPALPAPPAAGTRVPVAP